MLVEHSLENIFCKLDNDGKIDEFSLLKEACFHYQAKTKDSRLEVELSTKEQREFA